MTTADTAAPRRARLLPYSLWQLRDYALNRGVPTLIVMLLIGYLSLSEVLGKVNAPGGPPDFLVRRYGNSDAARAALRHDLSMGVVASVLGFLAFLGALFATNGIVSNDRKFGFYRFLFTKPLDPAAYYGTEFVVNSVSFVVLSSLLAGLYGRLMEPVLTASLLAALGAAYVCYAGLGFALSALSRWDWLELVAVAGAAEVLWPRYGASDSAFAWLLRLLPPVHRTGEVYAAAARGTPLPWTSVLWLVAYGTIAFVVGLAVLRHRRLAFN